MFLILERYKFISQLFGSRNFAQGDIVRQIYAFFFVLMTISHILAPLEYSDNRGQFIESLNGSTAYMIVLSFILHYLTNRDRFNALEMEVQDIVNDRIRLKRNDAMYAEVEKRFVFFTEIARKNVYLIVVFISFPFIRVAYDLCMGTYTTNSWMFLLKFWVPFELNTTLRVMSMEIFLIPMNCYSTLTLFTIFSFLAGIIIYIIAIVRDIRTIFDRMDKLMHSRKKNREMAVVEYCKEAIMFHARVCSCVEHLADVMNMIVFSTIVPSVFCICSSLLLFETIDDTAKLFKVLSPLTVLATIWNILTFIFIFGQMLHSNLIELSDLIYQSEWHRYPHSVQRAVLLMIIRAQKRFYVSAYGIITCDLESYRQVLKSLYSALMLLRNAK